ncbi:hypothetical protein [Sphingomonas jatrophae]|uniref:Uncharacterized protein n=1 Tax=Sphingomonas jatrophae TaxID=1166337 RepID=A0A1I6KBP6_9SPHN|nr:hypothetical protein [Sphingomonas jatrophae]SFR88672.1 hypothetical protein SAMN05192580_1548 [Sphingomonas jatrophae]
MSTGSPPPARRFVQPRAGDDWPAIAARELPDLPQNEAVERIKSWNLHLVFRPVSVITPSDILFVEPPRAREPVA